MNISTAATLTPTSEKVPVKGRFGFGMGEFGFVIIWQGTALFLMYYYTDVMGLSPAVAGVIYLIAMIFDAVIDPIVANVVDRTRTKMGRYRPWLLFGAIPFGLSYPLAFSNPESLPFAPWIWALVTHVFLRFTYTIASMPYNSLQVHLTPNSQERTLLAAFRIAGGATAALTVSFLTPVIVGRFGGDEAQGYFFVACIVGALTCITLLSCFAFIREPVETETPDKERPPFFKDMFSVFPMFIKNDQLIRVFLMWVVASISLGMFGKNIVYHFKYDAMRPDMIVWALVGPPLLFMITIPIWIKLAAAISKRNAMQIGLIIAIIGNMGFYFNPSQNVSTAMVFILLNGSGIAAFYVLFWPMFSDTIEYGELKTGIRAEAKTFALATFAQKAAIGINALTLGLALTVIGFEANEVQSPETLKGMKIIMAFVPSIGLAIMIWLVRGYKLDGETHAEIRAELDMRKRNLT